MKTHGLYSGKFVLSVVQLNQTDIATDEDKAYGIDYWARLFKAKTWEEIKMLAKNNEYLEETAESLYVANADEIVRQQCLAREDAERRERTLERDNQRLRVDLEMANKDLELANKNLEYWKKRAKELEQVAVEQR